MKWFDGTLLKMSGPTFGNFIKLIKLHSTGSWVSPRDRREHAPRGPAPSSKKLMIRCIDRITISYSVICYSVCIALTVTVTVLLPSWLVINFVLWPVGPFWSTMASSKKKFPLIRLVATPTNWSWLWHDYSRPLSGLPGGKGATGAQGDGDSLLLRYCRLYSDQVC